MASLKELIAQREAIDREIELTSKKEREDALSRVRELMAEYGLTSSDLSSRGAPKGRAAKGKKVAAKFRDATTGDSWSGRGLQPKWLKAALANGRKLTDFAL